MDAALKIGFVRRGFSATGGAEAYLRRLAAGVTQAGHEALLYTTDEWPGSEWEFGPLRRVRSTSALAFADEIEPLKTRDRCDVVMSLERVWNCDVYRAGDGVHRSWLKRRQHLDTRVRKLLRLLKGKHHDILRLEQSLFGSGGARRVITNSKMVRDEITGFYGYDSSQIDVIYNGVPVESFRPEPGQREASRTHLGLAAEDVAVLFVGSGWERKGLRNAVDAVDECRGLNLRLLVAGRGNAKQFSSSRAHFLGSVPDPRSVYSAADIFLLPTLYDPFSNACLEALASGLPVITTQSNGFSEIIDNGVHGTVVADPRDAEAIPNALRLWAEPRRREAARPAILQRASEFDITDNVAKTLQVLLRARN